MHRDADREKGRTPQNVDREKRKNHSRIKGALLFVPLAANRCLRHSWLPLYKLPDNL